MPRRKPHVIVPAKPLQVGERVKNYPAEGAEPIHGTAIEKYGKVFIQIDGEFGLVDPDKVFWTRVS